MRRIGLLITVLCLFLSCDTNYAEEQRKDICIVDPKGDTEIDYEIQSIETVMMFPDILTNSSRQGCACYGNTLLVFHDTNDIVEVYDIKTLTLKSVVNMTGIGLSNNEYHCNNANFGYQKYDSNDSFPLLYVSMEHLNQHRILVYRITGEIENLNFDLVQTIVLPEPSQISLYYPNCYVDAEKETIWISGYSTNSYQSSENNRLKYIKYGLPNVRNGNVIELKAEEIRQIDDFCSITATQGGCIYDGKLFQVFGIYAPRHFVVFNLSDSTIIRDNLLDLVDYEPEGLFVKDDVIYYTTQYCILKVYFKK